jgi:hypothetical protein
MSSLLIEVNVQTLVMRAMGCLPVQFLGFFGGGGGIECDGWALSRGSSSSPVSYFFLQAAHLQIPRQEGQIQLNRD